MSKITNELIDKVADSLEQNKSDDGVLMYAEGTYAVTDKEEAKFFLNMMCVDEDPSRFGSACDMLANENPSNAELFEAIKAAFNVVMEINNEA